MRKANTTRTNIHTTRTSSSAVGLSPAVRRARGHAVCVSGKDMSRRREIEVVRRTVHRKVRPLVSRNFWKAANLTYQRKEKVRHALDGVQERLFLFDPKIGDLFLVDGCHDDVRQYLPNDTVQVRQSVQHGLPRDALISFPLGI